MNKIIKFCAITIVFIFALNVSSYGMSISIFGNFLRSDKYIDSFIKEYNSTFKSYKESKEQVDLYKEAYFMWLDRYLQPVSNERKQKLVDDSIKSLQQYIKQQTENSKTLDAKEAMQQTMAYAFSNIDAHTTYLPKKDASNFNDRLSGKYKGIGIALRADPKDGGFIVDRVFDNSPAKKAGLYKNDKIIAVDDIEILQTDNLSSIVEKIRGQDGTTVILKVKRNNQVLNIYVKRGDYYIASVKSEIYEGKYGYISISSFNTDTASLFRVALNTLNVDNLEGLIIDVRNNPGGLLQAVVLISDSILAGDDIVSIKGRDVNYNQNFVSVNKTYVRSTLPIVVLINSGSASASELLAGALALNNRATLVGENSFGKWSVQSGFKLKDGSMFNITTQLFYGPKNATFQGIGIAPDIEVKTPYSDKLFRENKYPHYLITEDINNVIRQPKITVNQNQCGTKIYDANFDEPDYTLNCGILYLQTLNITDFSRRLSQ